MPKKLEIEKKTIAISMLREGNSIRSVARMAGIHRDTTMRMVGSGKLATVKFSTSGYCRARQCIS